MRILNLIWPSLLVLAQRDSILDEARYLRTIDGSIDEIITEVDQETFEMLNRTPDVHGLDRTIRYLREVPARRLPVNRGIRHVSLNNFRANLQNSFLAVCYEQDLLTEKCMCRERYPIRYIARNSTLESLALIAIEPANQQITISYRPTYSDRNMLTNLDFELTQYPGAPRGVLSHRGFTEYAQSLQPQAEKVLERLLRMPKYRQYTVHSTGYSLGAAVAIVAVPGWAKFMRERGFQHPFLTYSYSGPRPGNEPFAQYVANFKVPVIRYSNREDLVPHLPPRSFGYVHSGVEFHERRTGNNMTRVDLCSQAFDEDPDCGLNPHALLSPSRHYFPFNSYIPLPPFC